MNDQPDQQAETQSAVEWAIKQWADWVAGKGGSIMQDTIMPLARRADEAEKPEWRQACMKIGVLLAPITQAAGVAEAVEELYIQRADLLHQVGDLRAQLAAAQARADLEADNALELARRADEAEFWAKSWKANHDNQVRLKRALADRPDLKERAASWKKLNDDNEAIRARLAAAHDAIRTKEANELAALSEVDTLSAQLAAALAKKEGQR